MADTGLLGFNPYGKAVAVDFSSKPVQLAIQLQQKEDAKKEALDKYFMDYEKSINPAGMRGQDQDVFLGKLNEAKSYYLKNRDKILNPAKYGAEAQSQYMSMLKSGQSLIEQSKQAAAQDKINQEHYYQAQEKGYSTPDEYIPALERSHLSIGDPRYQPLDPFKYHFLKPFEAEDFRKAVYGAIKPSEKIISSKPTGKGEIIDTVSYELDPNQLRSVVNTAISKYRTDARTKTEVDRLIKSGEYKNLDQDYKLLNPKGNLDDANPEHVAAALAINLNQIGRTQEKRREDKAYWLNYQDRLIRNRGEYGQYSPEAQIQAIFNAGDAKSTPHITVEGQKIEGRKVILPPEMEGKYARKSGKHSQEPDYFYMSNDGKDLYPVFTTGEKTKSGADILDVKASEKIPVETSLIPTMGKTFGGIGWTRKNLYTDKPNASNIEKSYKFKGKSYSHKQLLDMGYSENDINQAINLGTIK